METTSQKYFHWGAIASMVSLIALCVLWETVLAPLKPGGSWMALKAAPLLFPLAGIVKRDVYTLQWTSMMVLLYFTEGVVRGWSDLGATSSWLGWSEAAIVTVYFLCAVMYVRPYKKAAKKIAKDLLEKVNKGHAAK
ncbi:DUF2069 domain-containing protein [Pseudoduganella namucuonensis]|uniref:Uncharacterized membrane protein n=1 Tax=Pseudoduganella namucuonensis TaxID=1035707 RepID=A0A1I7HLW6_9BURK|nr:DUF2069 domain-containing protein [Pseudoduganella namucuonensis]SFU61760.1 Uncharacterized membrane protein [Pseudoduganella namucuonensis]